MKKTIVFLLSFLGALAALQAQDAAEIVRASRNRISSGTVSTRARMIITSRDGTRTERLLDQYSKDGPNGSRSAIVFQQPAGVQGTRFLSMENASGGNDQWIFLPSLGKARRIAGSEGSASFMGSDFSYDDIASLSRDTDLDTHRILREEDLDGRPCHVVESVPKNRSYQYSRMIQWIDRESAVAWKLELYGRQNVLVKIITLGNFRDVQGRLTGHSTRALTVAQGSSTELSVELIRYDDPVPEAVFTTAWLETGRAR